MGVLCLLASCKKSDSNSASTFQVQVSGLTAKTLVTLKVTDNTTNSTTLSETSVSNGTYTSSQDVNYGDQLTITCNANVNDDASGDGDGTFKYFFKGDQMGAHGGQIDIAGFTENETVPTP